jgi:predicted ATP-binding protein involved in virulence
LEELEYSEDSSSQAEVGVIEKIVLQNFMCHKHFEIQFGLNTNFITGRNGSKCLLTFDILIAKGGKSAVLAALALCLGAKAGFTHRGGIE